MESRECPKCGLLNPPANDRCDDCKTRLDAVKTSRLQRLRRRARAYVAESSATAILITCGCALLMFSPIIALGALFLGPPVPHIPYATARDAVGGDSAEQETRGYGIYRDILGRNRSSISIRDGGDTMNCQDFVELRRIRTIQWMADDRVLLIGLDVVYHDSQKSEYLVRLLYDFEQAKLYGHNDQAYECEGPASRESLDEAAFQALVDSYE